MITLKAPYQFNVPKAPDDLYLQKLEDFSITDNQDDKVDYYVTEPEDDDSEEMKPIRLVEVVGAIKRRKFRQPRGDFKTNESVKRVAAKL
jgi:hypothetical protein